MAVSILSACLPVYKPMWKKAVVSCKRVFGSFPSFLSITRHFLKPRPLKSTKITDGSSEEKHIETATTKTPTTSSSPILRDESGFLRS